MYVYNEYLRDIYKTNKAQHFKQILINNGFKIKERGEIQQLNLNDRKQMKDINIKALERKFNEYIKEDNEENKDENFLYRQDYLKIESDEDINIFKEYITDKHKFTDYRNIIRLFYTDDKLKNILKEQNKNNVYYKNLYSTANKINLLRQLEKELKINMLDINFKQTDEKINISYMLLENIKKAFRTREEPKTYKELLPFYINRIENIIGDIPLFNKKRVQQDKKGRLNMNLM